MLTAGLCEARPSPARILHPCRKNDAFCGFLRRTAARLRVALRGETSPARASTEPSPSRTLPGSRQTQISALSQARHPRRTCEHGVRSAAPTNASARERRCRCKEVPSPRQRPRRSCFRLRRSRACKRISQTASSRHTNAARTPGSARERSPRPYSRQSRYSRARNAARGISSAPRRSMCGVVCWQSTISTPRSRSHAVRCTTAALEASG